MNKTGGKVPMSTELLANHPLTTTTLVKKCQRRHLQRCRLCDTWEHLLVLCLTQKTFKTTLYRQNTFIVFVGISHTWGDTKLSPLSFWQQIDPPLHSSSVFLMHSTHWRYLYHEKDKVLLWPRPLWIFMHVKHFILYEHIVIGIICDKTRPYGIVIYRIYIKDFETWEFSILDRGFGQSYACFHKKRYSCDKLNYVWGGYLE